MMMQVIAIAVGAVVGAVLGAVLGAIIYDAMRKSGIL